MREIIFAVVAAGFAFVASTPASASGEVAQVELCAAALSTQGLAAKGDYRAKFVKSRGGSIKTVTVELIPLVNGADVMTAECQIKRGEVVDVAVKA